MLASFCESYLRLRGARAGDGSPGRFRHGRGHQQADSLALQAGVTVISQSAVSLASTVLALLMMQPSLNSKTDATGMLFSTRLVKTIVSSIALDEFGRSGRFDATFLL